MSMVFFISIQRFVTMRTTSKKHSIGHVCLMLVLIKTFSAKAHASMIG